MDSLSLQGLLAQEKLQEAIAFVDSKIQLHPNILEIIISGLGKDTAKDALVRHLVLKKGLVPNGGTIYAAAIYKQEKLVKFLIQHSERLALREALDACFRTRGMSEAAFALLLTYV